ncbi:MAG: CBS domain-containing protein [Lutibacter sp.]|uniref:CBS domain-containing protein n=1 Tax=Lutibacter sp. TaxID=1925666 RepID=UPI001792A988|nr:CBS domain-containing protein [Lutibacter sp.]MBT8316388.1 CBS domain-containing protein [Lutibacter sp.]NNJ57248.1 CBS domain-containing protein [Lutibacter sp.]
MNRLDPVSKIMTTKLVTLTLMDDLFKAEKLFKEHHIRHIPIVENEHIIGMLGFTDLERISFLDAFDASETKIDNAIYNMLNIGQLMVKNLIKVNSSTTIKSVVEILSKNEFHALPVVENNILVGIVTTTDILKYLLNQYELELN